MTYTYTKSHSRRVRNGSAAVNRRTIALENLLKVKEPGERQAAEIEVLQKRTGRAV